MGNLGEWRSEGWTLDIQNIQTKVEELTNSQPLKIKISAINLTVLTYLWNELMEKMSRNSNNFF